MSKNNNVNPGQYKVAGRERMGENLGQDRAKMELVKNREQAGPPKRAAKRTEKLSERSRGRGKTSGESR